MIIKTIFFCLLTLALQAPLLAADPQIEGHLKIIKLNEDKMAMILKKANVLRTFISSGLGANSSLDCGTNVSGRMTAKCKEMIVLKKSYDALDVENVKLKNMVSSIDKAVMFTKVGIDTSPLNPIVQKNTKDIFEADNSTPDCTLQSLKGWKCLKTTVTTMEGNTYNILLKWNRPNIQSRGTIFWGLGGNGMGESREDPPSKAVMDQLDQLDSMRTVAYEMMDPTTGNDFGGGYWKHYGGYKSASQIFMAILELSVSRNLFQGNFLNYMGGSNGSTIPAYAMAKHNADIYFDRVVFQMGPFLSNINSACDPKSSSSFSLNKGEQFKFINELIALWSLGDPAKNVCPPIGDDRISVLKDGKKIYPDTHVHVIMGIKEIENGFGPWILASNLEWYESITARSKSRLIRNNMAHNNSYEDMRRFLKLAPDEIPDNSLEKCNEGTFIAGGEIYDYSCGCGTLVGGSLQADGCFHKATGKKAEVKMSNGVFCSPSGTLTEWVCGQRPENPSFRDQGNDCYHLGTSKKCKN